MVYNINTATSITGLHAATRFPALDAHSATTDGRRRTFSADISLFKYAQMRPRVSSWHMNPQAMDTPLKRTQMQVDQALEPLDAMEAKHVDSGIHFYLIDGVDIDCRCTWRRPVNLRRWPKRPCLC